MLNCNLSVRGDARGCEGMRKGSALDPLKELLRKFLKNLQKLSKKG